MISAMTTPPRWLSDRLAACSLGLLAVVLWLPRLHGPMDLRSDSAVYYILGSSITEGHGYRLLNEPGAIQAVQYPPLFPLVAAAYQWLLGTNDPVVVAPWLRLTCCGFFIAFTLANFAVLRRWLSVPVAMLGTVMVVLQVETFTMSELFYPEILYALLTLCFFLVSWRSQSVGNGVAAFLLATLAYFTRTVGIALLLAWVMESVLQRKLRQALMRGVAALVPVLAWQGYVGHVTGGAEYAHPAYAYQRAPYMFYNVTYATNIGTFIDPMMPELGRASTRDLVTRVARNVAQLPAKFGEVISSTRESYELPWKVYALPAPISTPWPVSVVLWILGGIVITGWCLMVRDQQWSVVVYSAVAVGLMCATPWPQQFDRYLVPVQPLLIACFLTASMAAIRLLGRAGRWSTGFVVVMITLILVQQLLVTRVMYSLRQPSVFRGPSGNSIMYDAFFFGEPYRALDRATDWLRTNAKVDEICAGSMPHGVYLRAGIRCVMSPFEADAHRAQALLDGVPVTYLIVDEGLALETARYMSRVIETYPGQWHQVYRTAIPPEPGRAAPGTLTVYRRTGQPVPGSSNQGNR